jgi:hypothetical protein
MIEVIDGDAAASREGDMQGPARRLALPNPEERLEANAEANGSAMAGLLRPDLHHDD